MDTHWRRPCAAHRPLIAALAAIFASPAMADCAGKPAFAFPPARTIEIDAHGGPIFGSVTRQEHEPSFLRPMEVMLTFDDGPMPWVTRSILNTLDEFCAPATFFSVGRMAVAYPEVVREIAARGHTLASHTMTHPFNMSRMPAAKAQDEIERGFAAVSAAAGAPIAPFFRFPGLADSSALLNYLQSRGIAAFSVDVVTNDSYIAGPQQLTERTLAAVERAKGGIILFHDIKRATAKALPDILKTLRSRGYSIIRVVAQTPVAPRVELLADYSGEIAAAKPVAAASQTLMPFYGRIGPLTGPSADDPTRVRIAPAARPRAPAATSPHIANSDGTATRMSPWTTHIRTHRKRP